MSLVWDTALMKFILLKYTSLTVNILDMQMDLEFTNFLK